MDQWKSVKATYMEDNRIDSVVLLFSFQRNNFIRNNSKYLIYMNIIRSIIERIYTVNPF